MGCRRTGGRKAPLTGVWVTQVTCECCVPVNTTLPSNTGKWSEAYLEEGDKNDNEHENPIM